VKVLGKVGNFILLATFSLCGYAVYDAHIKLSAAQVAIIQKDAEIATYTNLIDQHKKAGGLISRTRASKMIAALTKTTHDSCLNSNLSDVEVGQCKAAVHLDGLIRNIDE